VILVVGLSPCAPPDEDGDGGGGGAWRSWPAPELALAAAARSLAPLLGSHQLVVMNGACTIDEELRFARALRNESADRSVVTLVAQVEVDGLDPSFEAPAALIGPLSTAAEAHRLAAENDWTFRPSGSGWRRAVPTPEPVTHDDADAMRALLAAGSSVVCAGPGTPVTRDEAGRVHRVDAFVDVERSASLLATQLDAHALMLLSDDEPVRLLDDSGSVPVRRLSIADARAAELRPADRLRVEAACRFTEVTGRNAGIGRIAEAVDLLAGQAGLLISAGDVEPRFWGPAPR